jgi:putative redox protein
MDVASILRKKRQPFTHYEVRVVADRRDDPTPRVFEVIRILHVVDGEVDPEAVHRAVELSATKYCTVTVNLASGLAEIHHAYLIRSSHGDERYQEVVVTGPRMADPALERSASV